MDARWIRTAGARLVLLAAALAPGCARDEPPQQSPCVTDGDCVLVDRECCHFCSYATPPFVMNRGQEEASRARREARCRPQTPCPQPTCNFAVCITGYKAVCKANLCAVETTREGSSCGVDKPPRAP
jgi:hypothetical protein